MRNRFLISIRFLMHCILRKCIFLLALTSSLILIFNWVRQDGTSGIRFDHESNSERVTPVTTVKHGNKWIVVTSISYPTEDIKRLASFEDWNLVVVADTKTPIDWKWEGVHFLSVEYQKQLPFSVVSSLPFKSYTRKNIGYLYAISQGAEWIYDTDDDNKPYGLGLNQFQYEETVSGVRYVKNENSTGILNRLFNPYRFYGVDKMWPRGFPLEYLEKHTNGKNNQVLCYKMKRSAVQQGLVHHDPDVDAVYRLLNADSKTGLDVKFNEFAPPITLSVGTYSPWNSQNTLFHKSAFHTLFLPTTVSFRTTDIWRSFISQKILHLSGLTVSFVPTNAIKFRNAHDYLKDFKDEKQVYEDSGKMIEFLDNWNCSGSNNLEECIHKLMERLATEKLWGKEDSKLMRMFLNDLKSMGFELPALIDESDRNAYLAARNETEWNANCRRMHLEFELINPERYHKEDVRSAEQKLDYFGDLVEWCNETGYFNLSRSFPSARQLFKQHNDSYVLVQNRRNVLIVVNNYPWKYGHGLIQRLYQPYFASVVFCGSWYPNDIIEQDSYTSTINPLNYIHMNPTEILRGYFAYHCVTLVKEMQLNNVNGYFLMADDAVFNIWQRIDYSRVHHLTGPTKGEKGAWWPSKHGKKSASKIMMTVKGSNDPKLLKTWKKFEEGLRTSGYIGENGTAEDEMSEQRGKAISDFFYVPTSEIDYYATLMRLFYENEFFLELAVNKFLKSVNHQTSLIRASYLWETRGQWDKYYSQNMVAMHPLKMSQLRKSGKERKRYCSSVLQIWSNIVFGGSHNFTVKADDDEDYKYVK